MAYEPEGIETVYEGKRIRLERLTLLNTDTGATHTREIGRHPGAVCVLPLIDDATAVFIRQKRWAVNERIIELPAGTLEPGEAPINCAGRELLEETGFIARRIMPLSSFFTAPGLWDEKMYAFVARDLSRSRQRPDEGEEIERVVLTLEEALQMVRRGEIFDAKTICTLLHYHQFGDQPVGPDDSPIHME